MRIQISHYEFDLAEPFASGHVLSQSEAKALNSLRADRIRNRVTRWIDEAAPEGQVLTGGALEELRSRVTSLDQSFVFASRQNGPALRLGTLDAETRSVARERAETLARERDREGDDELVRQLVEGFVSDPEVQGEAAKRIEARRSVASGSLEDL